MGRGMPSRRGRITAGPQRRLDHRANVASSWAPSSNLLVEELPDELIDFARHLDVVQEPPRKRQKTAKTEEQGRADDGPGQGKSNEALDHIIIKESSWEVKCAGSKLSNFNAPLVRENVHLSIYIPPVGRGAGFIRVLDDKKRQIYAVPFPPAKDLPEDIRLALDVSRLYKGQWSSGQGRLWTVFGMALYQKEGADYLRFSFTLNWNITTSPYNIGQFTKKPPIVCEVLTAYFPDVNGAKNEAWSPQDFYQTAHVPDKDDQVAASLDPEDLASNLYPFQKRAVQWLLRREGVQWAGASRGIQRLEEPNSDSLPSSFMKITDADGRVYYVNNLYGLVTRDVTPFLTAERLLKGGILAEEMGLGKTVEIVSLVSLHKRPQEKQATIFDAYIEEDVRPASATLIISPPSILQQWISEINKHAPKLKVMHYKGVRNHGDKSSPELVDMLVAHDIVVSTYGVLGSELHYTKLNPEKSLRQKAKYPRVKSPLMQLSWWRVCIDEAQMIENGVSDSAVVARIIPRINAWTITGTPVRKDINDLRGLLIFLRHEPYASTKHVWESLISSHKHEFRRLFSTLALRHSKQSVRDELRLPAQRRYVIKMPLTAIEEQHYQEMFNQMCEEVGLDNEGSPVSDRWDPEKASTTETMRKWLVRLRQTALHPEVGGRNRRALGNKDGPLRTIEQVLTAMEEQADIVMRTDQRTMLISKLKKGQLFENSPRVKEALEIWTECYEEATAIVDECREQLSLELTEFGQGEKISSSKENGNSSSDDSDGSGILEETDPSSRLGVFRNRLRASLELQHMAAFFRANAYYQIKSNQEMTKPESPEFEILEKLETDSYEEAKRLRQEILQDIFQKADRRMKAIARKAAAQDFVQIPEFQSNHLKGGLESRRIAEQLETLGEALDAQANYLDEWREQTIQFLLRPLVDVDDGKEITGDEYEESTKTQDEVMVYVQTLRAAVTDRFDALTGQENQLTDYDVKVALRLAKDGEGAFPEKTIELLGIRQKLKPTKEMGSVRGVVADLRALATSLRLDAENGSARAQNELSIIEKQLSTTQKQLSEQTKASTALEKELDLFIAVVNLRIEFYRQLQEVSDMVAPYEGPNNERILARMVADEDKLTQKIATSKAKRRYLQHLRAEAENPQEPRICVICQETFEMGALTVCGHQFCKECIRLWWAAHRNCPVCKRKLIQADLHDITYKPQELSIQTEEVHQASHGRSSPSTGSRKSAIYSEVSKTKLAEIKNIELDGPSFTTKIDTLARHLIWLRESDPGAKSIIFCQFKDFLNVLAHAFERFRIGHTSIDKKDGIQKFKEDPGIECFLLHARAHSSGLNLVNASHVFICEPLLNTAIELQAIARVDRIGQHQETNVWLYLVDGTVEESIYQLSVRRRMEHIGQSSLKGKGKSKQSTPEALLDSSLEAANSMELQQASLARLLAKGGKGGEMIEKEDLWDCLFGDVGQRKVNHGVGNHQLRYDEAVRRHLGAEAAEQRRDES